MVSRIRLDVVRQLQVEAGFRVLRFDRLCENSLGLSNVIENDNTINSGDN
jgi:hypothetical protein